MSRRAIHAYCHNEWVVLIAMGKNTSELSGQIEKVTYSDEESGFTVARVKVQGRKDLVTIVGNLINPLPGEILKLKGEWANHSKYGEQFKVTGYSVSIPSTVNGIRKYLGSGLIRGIGPVMAERIVNQFGKETLNIIEEHPEKLTGIDGIGEKRVGMIKSAWKDQKEIRELMIFLQDYGVGSAYANRIFVQYKDQAIDVVRRNPYLLASDIRGIGFSTADGIAEKLGFRKNSGLRIQAGIIYVLSQLSDEGHVFYPNKLLLEKCCAMLKVNENLVEETLIRLETDRKIVSENNLASPGPGAEKDGAIYLTRFHTCETGVATQLKRLSGKPDFSRNIYAAEALGLIQGKLDIMLARQQIKAVRCAVEEKLMGNLKQKRSSYVKTGQT